MKNQEEEKMKKEESSIIDLPLNYFEEEKVLEVPEQVSFDLEEALFSSLDQFGRIDLEYIGSISGYQVEEVIQRLGNAIYQNPLTWEGSIHKGWETAEEYLSGNLMDKYRLAVKENEKYRGYFQKNVEALEKRMPPWLSADKIYITLGSPWVPSDIIDEFIYYMFRVGELERKRQPHFWSRAFCVRHDPITGVWEVPEKYRFSAMNDWTGEYLELNYSIWGTRRMEALSILEKALNLRDVVVYDKEYAPNKKGEKRVVNHQETLKAMDKQRSMIQAFQDWVWQDAGRKNRLQKIYFERYATIRKRVFDGGFLSLKNLNPSVTLYPYQKNAIARILFTPNTLLAHDVGAGKTHIMIVAGMELRRLGKSKKNLYVVPNSILRQWKEMFLYLYPSAHVFVVDKKNFKKEKREETLRSIMDNDYDAILMTYSCFDALPLSKKYYAAKYDEMMEKYKEIDDFFATEELQKKKEKQQWKEIEKEKKDAFENVICFDDLGINTLFVDEAHNYKNVTIETSIQHVYGISSGGSKKCDSMMDKVHCVQRQNMGRGVVFATGTPITNSITDIFVMQKYLQEGQLELLDIQNFDNWAGMFAQKQTQFEIDVDTNQYRMTTRFSKFCNIPELSSILASVADFYEIEQTAMLPKTEGYQNIILQGSPAFKKYLQNISLRAEKVRKGEVTRNEDNMLKITTDGRKAGLDMRLLDPSLSWPMTKVRKCAEMVMDIYRKTRDKHSTQIVFCDYSTPKNTFNLYDEMRLELIQQGMPIEEIEFIHDATTESKKEKLFQQMNEGKISVLIGSTLKLGTGVNVQSKLIAIHHLDIPWRPSDMVQREGRMLRQGNENEKVKIFRYITEASFDAYSWQLLEIKQRFINQLLSADMHVREGEDVDDIVLDYASVKALAVGNPLIKERVEIANELEKCVILQEEYVKEVLYIKNEIQRLPNLIQDLEEQIRLCKMDMEYYAEHRYVYHRSEAEQMNEFRHLVFQETMKHINKKEDKMVTTFQGFDVKVPKFMIPRYKKIKKVDETSLKEEEIMDYVPYILLSKNGSYAIDIPTEKTVVRQLVYCLEHLDERCARLQEELEKNRNRLQHLNENLQEKKGYDQTIEELKRKLAEINRKMGIQDGE